MKWGWFSLIEQHVDETFEPEDMRHQKCMGLKSCVLELDKQDYF